MAEVGTYTITADDGEITATDFTNVVSAAPTSTPPPPASVEIVGIVGNRADSSAIGFDTITLTIKTTTGSGPVDLSRMVIALQSETERIDSITYIPDTWASSQTSQEFYVVELRDDDNSLDASTTMTTVINAEDLVNIILKPWSSTAFPPREPMRIEIKPKYGDVVVKDLIAPPSYSVDLYITLFP